MYFNIKLDSSVKHLTKVARTVLSGNIQNGIEKFIFILLFSFACLTASAQYTPPYAVYKPITSSRNNNSQSSNSSKVWKEYWGQRTSSKMQVVDGIYLKNGKYQVNRFKLKIYEDGTVKVAEYLENGRWRSAYDTAIYELITIPEALKGLVTHYAAVYGFGNVYF